MLQNTVITPLACTGLFSGRFCRLAKINRARPAFHQYIAKNNEIAVNFAILRVGDILASAYL